MGVIGNTFISQLRGLLLGELTAAVEFTLQGGGGGLEGDPGGGMGELGLLKLVG